jgi:hemerythrin-like domain-containing protein
MDRPATSAPGFDEPLETLAACHERIESQLATLERMLAAEGSDAVAAARAAIDYFDTEGELHYRDEDEDLFPLLRRLAAEQGRAEIAAAIEDLEREHAVMAWQWARLRAALDAVARGVGNVGGEEVARFTWLYRRHMDRETAAILPFARTALSAGQRAALGTRMAARRGPVPKQ